MGISSDYIVQDLHNQGTDYGNSMGAYSWFPIYDPVRKRFVMFYPRRLSDSAFNEVYLSYSYIDYEELLSNNYVTLREGPTPSPTDTKLPANRAEGTRRVSVNIDIVGGYYEEGLTTDMIHLYITSFERVNTSGQSGTFEDNGMQLNKNLYHVQVRVSDYSIYLSSKLDYITPTNIHFDIDFPGAPATPPGYSPPYAGGVGSSHELSLNRILGVMHAETPPNLIYKPESYISTTVPKSRYAKYNDYSVNLQLESQYNIDPNQADTVNYYTDPNSLARYFYNRYIQGLVNSSIGSGVTSNLSDDRIYPETVLGVYVKKYFNNEDGTNNRAQISLNAYKYEAEEFISRRLNDGQGFGNQVINTPGTYVSHAEYNGESMSVSIPGIRPLQCYHLCHLSAGHTVRVIFGKSDESLLTLENIIGNQRFEVNLSELIHAEARLFDYFYSFVDAITFKYITGLNYKTIRRSNGNILFLMRYWVWGSGGNHTYKWFLAEIQDGVVVRSTTWDAIKVGIYDIYTYEMRYDEAEENIIFDCYRHKTKIFDDLDVIGFVAADGAVVGLRRATMSANFDGLSQPNMSSTDLYSSSREHIAGRCLHLSKEINGSKVDLTVIGKDARINTYFEVVAEFFSIEVTLWAKDSSGNDIYGVSYEKFENGAWDGIATGYPSVIASFTPGEHRIRATYGFHQPDERIITVGAEGVSEVNFVLEAWQFDYEHEDTMRVGETQYSVMELSASTPIDDTGTSVYYSWSYENASENRNADVNSGIKNQTEITGVTIQLAKVGE